MSNHLLIRVSIKTFGNTLADEDLTEGIQREKEMAADAVSVSVHKLRPEVLKPLELHARAVRKWRDVLTLPWEDNQRLHAPWF